VALLHGHRENSIALPGLCKAVLLRAFAHAPQSEPRVSKRPGAIPARREAQRRHVSGIYARHMPPIRCGTPALGCSGWHSAPPRASASGPVPPPYASRTSLDASRVHPSAGKTLAAIPTRSLRLPASPISPHVIQLYGRPALAGRRARPPRAAGANAAGRRMALEQQKKDTKRTHRSALALSKTRFSPQKRTQTNPNEPNSPHAATRPRLIPMTSAATALGYVGPGADSALARSREHRGYLY
jgi:hypothetical protein